MAVWVPPPVAAIVSVRPPSGVAPPARAWVTPPARPNAVKAAELELEIDRSAVVPVCSTTLPLATAEVVPPLRPSILLSKVPTLSVTLIWFAPVAPEATKVRVWPSTVMVSLAAKPAVKLSELAAVCSRVALVIAAGVLRLLLTAVPVKVASVKAAGVPSRLLAVAPAIAAEVTLDLVV